MSKYAYCLIRPSQETKFFDLACSLPLNEQDRQALAMVNLVGVEVNIAQREWIVRIRSEQQLSQDCLSAVSRVLCDKCDLTRVVFEYVTDSATFELRPYLVTNWPGIVESLSQAMPSVKGVVSKIAWSVQGDTTLYLSIGSLMGLELLKQKQIPQWLEQYFFKNMGNKIHVILDLNDVLDEIPEPCDPEPELLILPDKPNKTAQPSTIIFGRKIKEQPVALHDIRDEERRVVVAGYIFNLDVRELRSGKRLISFDITDHTDSLSVKLFADKDNVGKLTENLTDGLYVCIQGSVQLDNYSRELTLMADSIMRADPPVRQDHSERKRIELHVHTRMSSMDAIIPVQELIKTAAQWGHPAIAITDHGVVQAYPDAYSAGKKNNIKIIFGVEGYLVDDEDVHGPSYHIVILVKNKVGLRNLYELITDSHIHHFYKKPRIMRSILIKHREGLLFGSACEAGELIRAMLDGRDQQQIEQIAAFYDYLEIQPIGNNEFLVRENKVADDEGLRALNLRIVELGQQLGKLVVATTDAHFLNPEDEVYRRILMAGQGYKDSDNQAPLYFRTTDEMLDEFSYLGEDKAAEVVIDNPLRIAEEIEDIQPIPDKLFAPTIPGAEEAIRQMSYDHAYATYGNPLPQIVEQRLKLELDSIIGHGFSVLYFIAHKLVKHSNENGYLVGSRGSVGSSFVATMCGITEVNPLPPHYRCPHCNYNEFITDGSVGCGADLPSKVCPNCGTNLYKDGHDIPFAVFLGIDGDKIPDIDLNFSGDDQPQAHKYTEELFGHDHVFRAGTIATVADRTAYGFVMGYQTDHQMHLRAAEVNRLVSGCTGVKRTTGQHPGGVMVVPRDCDIHEFTPVQYPADEKNSGTRTTHFDYHSIHDSLVKLDILGHDDPTVIRMLEDLTGINAREIPLDEAQTMAIFSGLDSLGLTEDQLGSKLGSIGIPEFGTKFVRQMLEDTQPKTFSELVRISGFSHGTDVWLNNAQDLIKSGTCKLSEAISTRDDIMIYLIHKGMEPRQSFKIMEGVRKGKGVKEDDAQAMLEHGVPQWYLDSCRKIQYMFPKAHATAYVMMAFRIAWFKVHHPLAFYATYFSVRALEDFDAMLMTQGISAVRSKMQEISSKGREASKKEKDQLTVLEVVLEMYLRGFKFKKIDLYRSDARKFLIDEQCLLPPFASLQGLGGSAAESIVAARAGVTFTSIEDLRQRAHISKAVIETLQKHGCLDGMPEQAQIALFG